MTRRQMKTTRQKIRQERHDFAEEAVTRREAKVRSEKSGEKK